MFTTIVRASPVPAKLDVLGVGISTTSYAEVTAACAGWIAQRASAVSAMPAHYVCVTSVHGVMEARKDGTIRDILNGADIATPDGMPLVWALRSFGERHQERVYGPTLMLTLCDQAERLGHRIFLYGGREETLDLLCANLLRRFPGLRFAGKYSPPFRALTSAEDEEVCALIASSKPDLLFVGISTPKQERWMANHKERFPGLVMVGVGAAFDFHAGCVSQAPPWMQARGLEWLYRLGKEPSRLWKRYILVTPWFLPCWGMQKLSVVIHDIACGQHKRHSQPTTAR
jgi:N-acetylglucosaminyldiphosphoundecaprenol N-acetyl-beta-D-mannosaminyltransferase